MTQRISTGLANSLASMIASTFSDGFLELYAGAPGSTPEITSNGTLLGTILLPAVAFGAPSGGAIAKSGQWFGTIYATGTVAWGRFCDRTNALHLVVTVSITGGSGELKLDNLSLVEGGVVDVASFTYTVPIAA